MLAAWIVVLGLHHLLHGLHLQGTALPAVLVNLNAGVPLLQGPFLFLYVDALTSGRSRPRWLDALHFLPFVAFGVQVTLWLPGIDPAASSTVSVYHLSGWITLAILVSVPAYALASLRELRRHDEAVLERYSEQQGRDLRWLRRIVLALLCVWVVVFVAILMPSPLGPRIRHGVMGAVTLFLYAIGYFGWRQFAVVEPTEPGPRDAVDGVASDDGEAPRYERSGLQGDEIGDLAARLVIHLEEDRPHLEPGVTLAQIAGNLGTSPNHLSQAINQGLEKNFHELINERRVEEFRRRALEPRNRHRTLLAIALDSGFNSKSSFNRVFKQQTGMSPRQYVERAGADDDPHGSAAP